MPSNEATRISALRSSATKSSYLNARFLAISESFRTFPKLLAEKNIWGPVSTQKALMALGPRFTKTINEDQDTNTKVWLTTCQQYPKPCHRLTRQSKMRQNSTKQTTQVIFLVEETKLSFPCHKLNRPSVEKVEHSGTMLQSQLLSAGSWMTPWLLKANDVQLGILTSWALPYEDSTRDLANSSYCPSCQASAER